MYPYHARLSSWAYGGAGLMTPVVRGTYSRRVNDAGRCEIEILSQLDELDRLSPYPGQSFIVLHCRGRIEDAWAVMDYERSRFGTIRVYGENLAYLLRDYVIDTPSDASAGTTGDYTQLMRDFIESFPKNPTITGSVWRARPMRCGFSGTYKPMWASPAQVLSTIADMASLELAYRLVWHVRAHSVAGFTLSIPRASTFIVIPRYRTLPPSLGYCDSVRVERSSTYTLTTGLGKGMGSDRNVLAAESPIAGYHKFASYTPLRREAQSSRPTDDAVVAARIASRMSRGRYSGTIRLRPNLRYWDHFELGDILTVSAPSAHRGGHTAIRSVTGTVVEIRGEMADGVMQHTVDLG